MNNREIKFRVWDTLTKKMVSVGFHLIGETTVFGLMNQYALENKGDRKDLLERYNDFVITQFTGLQDCNGRDIYEGDIIKAENNFGEVKYKHYSFCLEKFDPTFSDFFPLSGLKVFYKDKYFIDGNIFENSEKPKTRYELALTCLDIRRQAHEDLHIWSHSKKEYCQYCREIDLKFKIIRYLEDYPIATLKSIYNNFKRSTPFLERLFLKYNIKKALKTLKDIDNIIDGEEKDGKMMFYWLKK